MTGDWRWQTSVNRGATQPLDPMAFRGADQAGMNGAQGFALVSPPGYGAPPQASWPVPSGWYQGAPPSGRYPYPEAPNAGAGDLAALSAAAYAGAPILDPQTYASLYAQAVGGYDAYLAYQAEEASSAAQSWGEPEPEKVEAPVADNPVLRALGLLG